MPRKSTQQCVNWWPNSGGKRRKRLAVALAPAVAVVGAEPGVVGLGLDRPRGRAQRQQIDHHGLVVALPVVGDEAAFPASSRGRWTAGAPGPRPSRRGHRARRPALRMLASSDGCGRRQRSSARAGRPSAAARCRRWTARSGRSAALPSCRGSDRKSPCGRPRRVLPGPCGRPAKEAQRGQRAIAGLAPGDVAARHATG